MNAHDHSFTLIDGAALPLSEFAGRPILLVNTASECGYTPQYAGLQTLWQRYGDRGLVVLGVPSNDFGAQEPGADPAIKAFCESNYGVAFPLAAKEQVVGDGAHPLYVAIHDALEGAADPAWNFHKFLFSGDGSLAEVWPARVEPLADEIIQAIEAQLPDS
jgi:glutathione peroxidase